MAPTLASIAAPAVQNNNVNPATRQHDPQEKAAIEKGLPETYVDSIRVDGLALLKIIKHSRETHTVLASQSSNITHFSPAVGQLLGIDSEGVLEVSSALPLPAGTLGGARDEGTDDSKGIKAAAKYTAAIMPKLADLNADTSLVGFYMSTNNGQHLAVSGFVEALLTAQTHGTGLSLARNKNPAIGETNEYGKGIALVYDVASASEGYVGLKAFRLSPEFIEVHKAGRFDTASLTEHKLVPSNILVEIPVTLRSSPLLTSFLSTLYTAPASSIPALPVVSFSQLALAAPNTTSLSNPLIALLGALETHQSYLSTLSFQARQLTRERARVEALPSVIKRRQENEQRAKDGKPLLPLTSEEAALVEPSRLETMCALAGVEGAVKVLSQSTAAALVKSYGAKAGVVGATL